MKTWFKVQAKDDSAAGVEVSIFDDIGAWGVTAKDFIAAVKPHAGKNITVSINSPGGSVFDALAIYNALRSLGSEITVRVLGVAASAASLIAMAGNKIIMPENTFMMVHNPWAFAAGNADELRDFADTLDTIGSALVKTYVARTGLSEEEVKALLDAETYLTAEEAVAKGFATEMEPALKIAASFDVDRLPEAVRAAFDAAGEGEEPATEGEEPTAAEGEEPAAAAEPEVLDDTLADEIMAAAAQAGLADFAASIALNPSVKSLDDAKALLGTAREIRSLCVLAKQSELAPKLIRDGASVDEARALLCEVLARADEAMHTNSTTPVQNGKATASGADVWSKIFPPQSRAN